MRNGIELSAIFELNSVINQIKKRQNKDFHFSTEIHKTGYSKHLSISCQT